MRTFYGLHVWGDAGPINLDWTINHQGESYDNRDISAWLLGVANGVTLSRLPVVLGSARPVFPSDRLSHAGTRQVKQAPFAPPVARW